MQHWHLMVNIPVLMFSGILCVDYWISQFNPLNANPTKWSNTLKQFVANLPTNCLSVFDHFAGLALKGLISYLLSYPDHEMNIMHRLQDVVLQHTNLLNDVIDLSAQLDW